MNRVSLGYIGLLSLLCGCVSAPHEELRKFDIAAGDAATTLNEFSLQAHKQVLFDYEVLHNRQTRAVEGTLQPSEALRSMLQGTDLVASNVSALTVAIAPGRR